MVVNTGTAFGYITVNGCQRNTPRSPRASRNDAALEFECPEEFGYYPHPRDCTQYYVCVFGGALLESCTGGLMYSHELQTCDWPRNVGCQSSSAANQDVEDEDPLLERAAKAESQQRQHQQRQPVHRQQVQLTSPSPSLSQATERQSHHRPQQQHQHRTYPDEEYEPASEIESDRQQRVYRGQPSTIGQVQRDRDGLRRNIISVSPTHPSHPASITSPPTPPQSSDEDNDSVGHETTASQTTTKDRNSSITTLTTTTTTTTTTSMSSSSSSTANFPTRSNVGQSRDRKDYAIYEATRRNYIIVSSPSPFKLPPREDTDKDKDNYDDDQPAVTTLQSIRTPPVLSDQPFQVNVVPDQTVSPPSTIDALPDVDSTVVTHSTSNSNSQSQSSRFDDLEQNEISVSPPAPRKRPTYDFYDESIGKSNSNYIIGTSSLRPRVKSRIANRGRERYHGSNYVTMKVVRKRPVSDRDQDTKDSFKSDVKVPLSRSTTPSTQTPSSSPTTPSLPSTSADQRKNQKILHLPQKVLAATGPGKSDRLDDTPTTLSPLKRAYIMSKLQQQRDQEDVEGNEISPASGLQHQYKSFDSKKHDIRLPQTLTGNSSITSTTTSVSKTMLTGVAEVKASTKIVKATSLYPAKVELSTTPTPFRHEREKESFARIQTDSPYRTIPSENPRVVKTTPSTPAVPAPTISKAYYDHDSYPYYLYDDDVSIYKDDDYPQYALNQSVPIQSHPPQQQTVRIAEVTPNSKAYTQKSKKVPANDVNKYNFNSEVTAADYDIYDNQGHKNKFHINDQQSYRPNSISPQVVHVTTPNAIDAYVPLTTTTQAPPTTTARPYTTVTVPSRSRQNVNRGTAPPRLRPTLKPSTEIVSKAQEFVDIYRHPPSRPAPIYPTPQVDKPAAKCRKDVCLLPDCNCGGPDIPGGIDVEQTPQIVLLTFDDAVNDLNKQLYEDLFERGRKNPNGCPISATFYVSHEWTDYSQVQNLYADGHELASHTVSRNNDNTITKSRHSFGEQFSARKWAREVAGQREILAAYGGVKLEDVKGMRAPFLSVGGNNMFRMLWETNFTYDSSMPIYENRPPSWPYTLDYKLFHDCMIPPCPTRSYPGLWEVPMVMWQDLNGGRCSMGDACSNPPTADGGRPKKCNNPKVCNLWHKSGVRYMKTCQPCPDIYPWTGKTGIRSSRIDNDIEN
ncbi:hypothetical protein G9C98_004196 [Cotesia typhae]|uniref:Chitin-binding type-2 domain-containing protein n=1 Tax=Cotesia typhae TaxID=2053667 RepID=A0A8J5V7I9_9HYME|nr:hypothetical protein G9C98_004196 [Cotesia typhae]